MHTWIPHQNFVQVARCLNDTHLENQCDDAWALLQFLVEPPPVVYPRLQRMPCVIMWAGYENSLGQYLIAMLNERDLRRARKRPPVPNDNMLRLVRDFLRNHRGLPLKYPPWLSDQQLLRSHRSQLRAKSEAYVRKWTTPANLPVYWPVELPPQPSEEELMAERDEEERLGPDHPIYCDATREYTTETEDGSKVVLQRPVHTSKPSISGVRVVWSGFTRQVG